MEYIKDVPTIDEYILIDNNKYKVKNAEYFRDCWDIGINVEGTQEDFDKLKRLNDENKNNKK